MKVKKYEAPTMPEAMKQVRNEFGSEAVILHSRKVNHRGFMGIKKKSHVEVVAALDPYPVKQNKKQSERSIAPVMETGKSSRPTDQVLSELHVLKQMIHQSTTNKNNYPAEYQFMYMHLLDQEIEETIAGSILDQVAAHHKVENISPSREKVEQDVKREIMHQLKGLPFQAISADSKIAHFVGPTGVGKTTTIAKIAANAVLTEEKKVAFITTDTYRIAAIEQLKTYAKILQVPVEVAYTKEDYVNAVEKFKNYDRILVDTAGRNFREESFVHELKESFGSDDPIDMYLVLSLTAKSKDILDIYDQFVHLPIKQLIFTKIDETRQYGSMLNMALKKRMGTAYITNGQDVPDDLMEATPELIANYCIGGNPYA
ncbi:flagellar biosynthesis protein FlhF [Virgibacillus kimchii]